MAGRARFVRADSKQKEMVFASHRLNIDILREANRIPTANISLSNHDRGRVEGEMVNADFFAPGQEIEIQLCPNPQVSSTFQSVFKGIVVKYAMSGFVNNTSLELSLKDVAVKLTTCRKSKVFIGTDSQVIQTILDSAAISAGDIAPTQVEHPEIVQYACTDWDFILSRAEANGLWVSVTDGVMTTLSPDLTNAGKGTYTLKLPQKADPKQCADKLTQPGVQPDIFYISELEMAADIRQQYGAIASTSWNIETQSFDEFSATDQAAGASQPDSSIWETTLGTAQCDLIGSVEFNEQEAQAWADAQMTKTRLSLFRGWVTGGAFPALQLGDVVNIEGVSALFDGITRVSGIRHQVSAAGWQTNVQFGQSSDWFWQTQAVSEPPTSGLVPAVSGLQIGIVDAFMADDKSMYRVRVKVPALVYQAEDDSGSIWARLATLDAGAGRGSVFRPEAGDEVILGFLHDDPRQAVILGALHSTKNKAPWEPEETNSLTGIVTKKNVKLLFNDTDDQESITMEMPTGNQLIFSDGEEAKSFQITDKNGNTLVMSDLGIHIKSCGDILMEAPDGMVTVEGKEIEMI